MAKWLLRAAVRLRMRYQFMNLSNYIRSMPPNENNKKKIEIQMYTMCSYEKVATIVIAHRQRAPGGERESNPTETRALDGV